MFLWKYLKCDLITTLNLAIVLGGWMLWAPFGWQNIMFFHGLLPSCGFPGLWTLWGLLYSRLTCSQLCKAIADQKALSVSQFFILLNWQLSSMAMILFNYNTGHPQSLHALHYCWNLAAFTGDKNPKINNNNKKQARFEGGTLCNCYTTSQNKRFLNCQGRTVYALCIFLFPTIKILY